ncbi:alpha/beta fold hydrolase [Nocardia sp. CA2R105]|uniref:alpha/beta hydrolase n=1 Tax=Nocardia coffeae TaxID=2873381 RepID=UPI001CA62AE0|nr:alpha/beta hydrolase [Nocardia coffeae]MBY8862299.1 alpha/beta fold hydrolase [Nocardia coffeae]
MTIAEDDRTSFDRGLPDPSKPVVRQVADIDGVPMSALLATAPAPRAVLVALHGGATTSVYFDCPGHPELSLLRTAAAAGFTVLALDRPGYGSSREFADRFHDPQRRIDAMYAAIDQHLGPQPRGAGIFLMAHSAGCELAARMAGHERGAGLLGLELAGTGRERHAESAALFSGVRPDVLRIRTLLWSPARLYPADLIGGRPIGWVGGPRYEAEAAEAGSWADVRFPALAAPIGIPLRFTVGEYERVWRNDPEELAEVASLFTAAPRVVLNIQPNTGHNLSLGYSAAAYHLKLLSFAEECAIARETGEFSGPATQWDGIAPSRR